MKVKRFTTSNMQAALRQIAHELGDDAVILSTKKTAQGIEVVAALDYQPHTSDYEIERQLHLQDELQRAKQDLLERGRDQRISQARKADVSSHAGLVEALNKLKQPAFSVATPMPATPQPLIQEAPAAPLQHESLQQMQSELQELKQLMLQQYRQPAASKAPVIARPNVRVQAEIQARCHEMGLDSALVERLIAHISTTDSEVAWQQIIMWLEKNLPIASHSFIEKGGVVALVGPTGAGKTTTIGKVAAQAVLRHGAQAVALVTLDNYRVAAHDQLRTFAKILEVELKVVPPTGDLNKALQELKDKKLVLIDTAGLSAQDPHFSTQLALLRRTGMKVRKLLVLPLTSQARNLQENYRQFKLLGLSGCIFTKLDECFSLGAALSVVIRGQLPITLVANGPHIPQDIQYPNAKKLVRLAQRMTNNAYTKWHSEVQARVALQ